MTSLCSPPLLCHVYAHHGDNPSIRPFNNLYPQQKLQLDIIIVAELILQGVATFEGQEEFYQIKTETEMLAKLSIQISSINQTQRGLSLSSKKVTQNINRYQDQVGVEIFIEYSPIHKIE